MIPKIIFGASVLALLGCSAPAPAPVGPIPLRKAGAPMWSAAGFLHHKLEGNWYQVAGFAAQAGSGCNPGQVQFYMSEGRFKVDGRLCLNGRLERLRTEIGTSGPGRLTVQGMADWWILWVDADYRTIAIATPSGEWGFVLDRKNAPSDRLNAAAEIFDFNGYSKVNMQKYGPYVGP